MTDAAVERAKANTRGILAMIAAMVCFTATDAMMKLATETLPPGEVIAMRGLIGTILLVLILRMTGPLQNLSEIGNKFVLQRAAFEMIFIVAYIFALSLAPFANVFSVLQSAPIMITAGAAIIWREPVGWRRWSAIFIGFAGVAMIVKPSPQAFEPAMGLALLAALMVAGRDLTTRVIPRTVPSQVITIASMGSMMIAGFLIWPVENWAWPGPLAWVWLTGAGAAVALGCHLIIIAYRIAEASAVSPFRYASVPFAILIGFAVWRQVPDAIAFTGIVLIVACGLYMLHRERQARHGG